LAEDLLNSIALLLLLLNPFLLILYLLGQVVFERLPQARFESFQTKL